MGLILLEALLALGLLVFLVWWTMFSGRKRGEPPDHASNLARKTQHPPDQPRSEGGQKN
jgi:cbb3-type cytochrome oxidase subunit 3